MTAENQISVREVCRQVGFADNLYKYCRKNDPDFPLGGAPLAFGRAPEEGAGMEEGGPDSEGFDKELAASALAVPPPPAADWKPQPEGFFEDLPIKQILMYGGVAAAAWFIIAKMRKDTDEQRMISATTAAPGENVTSPRAA